MGNSLGLQCSVNIGGSTAVGMLRGTGGQLTYAARKIIAGSAASPLQGLIGYAASTGARSAIAVDFKVPYSGGAILTAALAAAGASITLGFGSAGGLTLATAFCESLQVSGSEGGDIECSATFQSTSLLAAGGGGSPVAADYFKFTDVISCNGPGFSSTDLNSFVFRIARTLAAYRGNSPYGIPKYLKIADTECSMDIEYLKTSEGATSAAVVQPLQTADASVVLSGNPLVSGGPTGGMTLTCQAAFHDPSPTTNGNLEDFVTERYTVKASLGGYSIG